MASILTQTAALLIASFESMKHAKHLCGYKHTDLRALTVVSDLARSLKHELIAYCYSNVQSLHEGARNEKYTQSFSLMTFLKKI